jgi:hypothetical protein
MRFHLRIPVRDNRKEDTAKQICQYLSANGEFPVVTGVHVFGHRATPMASKANNEISAIALARGLGSTAPVFSDDEVLLLLRAAIECEGSRAEFAKRYGLDRAYLNMVLNGRRPIGNSIVKALGLRKAYVAESMPTDCDSAGGRSHPTPWSVDPRGCGDQEADQPIAVASATIARSNSANTPII